MKNTKSDANKISGVTFDLWETLLHDKDGANADRTFARCRNLAQTMNRFGVTVSIEQVESALDKTISSLTKEWDLNRDYTHMAQLRSILRFLSNNVCNLEDKWLQELSEAYVSPLYEVPPYLNPDVFPVLRQLKQQKKKIGLICNTGLTPGFGLRGFLSEYGAAQFLDVMIFSDEIGIRKPDSRIFKLAARRLGTKPQQIVHVGDNLKTDVWGAKNAGFRAIHLSADEGRDFSAEKDPKSLAVLSRSLGKLLGREMPPDKTITTLATLTDAIEEIENQGLQ